MMSMASATIAYDDREGRRGQRPRRPNGGMSMSVRTETADRVTTIVIDRPERRNAVDGPTAEALADAFRAFEGDAHARVAVLCGAGGTFCAGADLKAIGAGSGNRVRAEGDGPM